MSANAQARQDGLLATTFDRLLHRKTAIHASTDGIKRAALGS